MEFLQLTYFAHAARAESFSETARFFSVPPSSVSLSVKRLEKELGCALFDRTANRLALNEKGKHFLSAVDTVFETLEKAKEEIADKEDVMQGEIKMLICAHRRTVTEKIAAFRARYPHVRFSIHHGKPIAKTGEYHIVVSETPPAPFGYERFFLLREEMMLALPKGHPLCAEKSVPISRLATEHFISMTEGTSLREYTNRLFRICGISPEIAIECDDPYYIREYLRMNFGVAVVPALSWKDQFPEEITLKRMENAPTREICFYVEKNAPPTARRFVALALENNHSPI